MRRVASMRLATVLAAALLVAVSATGCAPAAESDPQSISISYSEDGTTSNAEIAVDGLRCSEAQGLRTFIGGGDVEGRAAVTISILDGQATVAIHLEDDRWFVSSGGAEPDGDSVTFDGFEGSVVEQGTDLDILGIVDEAATLSGTLACS